MTSPRTAAIGLGLADIAVTTLGALAVTALFPSASAWTARLIVVLVPDRRAATPGTPIG
ncbi:hypothetical protein ACQP1P_19100 [Dactylosporangium sp. CA-052675]|uniref:hypothetical protein n=1 Tax=Dactylosporangium sp. CA-052675 TaxID=3239927 RepID=UPI003D89C842